MNMKNERGKRLLKIAIVFAILVFAAIGIVAFSNYEPETVYARPSTSGHLHVKDTKLRDEKDRPVQLKGMSSHGIIYSPKIITEPFISALSNDWGANLFRAAMYSYDFVERWADLNLWYLHDAIDWAIQNDMYVIIDWHTLSDNNPNKYVDNAIDFFRNIADKYSDCPNVIYEICNEPNSGTTWEQICDYANKVIPVIKEKNPDAVILCGTPNYCQNISEIADSLLTDYSNVMYTFHFYAGTHTDLYRKNLINALDNLHVPVFVSEFGLTDMSGDGPLDYEQAKLWIDLLNEKTVPYAMWSYSDLPESSSVFVNNVISIDNMNDAGLKSSGRWAKAMLAGDDLSTFTNAK